MSEPIRYFPKSFIFSPEMTDFFTEITNDKDLQNALYNTDTIADVASIAKERGFDVPASEILKAQAGRALAIVDEGSDDIARLINGEKPLTGAQWGRGGGGYLDSAGFWFVKLIPSEIITDKSAEVLPATQEVTSNKALEEAILPAKTMMDLAEVLESHSHVIAPVTLLIHQAQTILALDRDTCDKMASR